MSRWAVGASLVVSGLLIGACGSQSGSGVADAVPVPETPAQAVLEPAELVAQMSDLAWAEEVDAAEALIESQRPHHDEASPHWLLAVSWLGRGASFAERWDVAERYAREAFEGSAALLGARELDADRELQLALGAGIEVLGHAMDAAGDREGAVEFLSDQREAYRGTSVEMRIQKNALLLSLEGQPFPVLDVEEYVGAPLPTAESLEGKVVIAFFWAHWCPDCKRQLPVLDRLHEEHGDEIAIIGPTQFWGYTSRGQDATPEEELAYLRGEYNEQSPIPEWMSVPVSQQNFLDFGVSTTPTLVLIDRDGIVRLYNPGDLPYDELAPQVERLLS